MPRTYRRPSRRSGRTSGPRAAVPHVTWRNGSASARPRVPQSARRRRADARSRPSAVRSYASAGRALLVRRGADDAGALEPPQSIGQDVRGDAGQGFGELAEPAWAVEHRLDDEQAPAVADPVERGLERELGGGRSSASDGSRRGSVSSGLVMSDSSVVTCKSQVTTRFPIANTGVHRHERYRRARCGGRRRRRDAPARPS